jgi:hypothetical protein
MNPYELAITGIDRHATKQLVGELAHDFDSWASIMREIGGGHCPSCGRSNTALFRGRVTCPHCRWCETD